MGFIITFRFKELWSPLFCGRGLFSTIQPGPVKFGDPPPPSANHRGKAW
jgi:hypothetical protein